MKKIIFFLFLSGIINAQIIDLYVLAGQSNAIGWYGDATYYPTDSNNLDSKILLAYKIDDKLGGGPASNGWISMQKQVGRFPAGHFGPEVTFSRKLAQEGKNIALFKYGQGSTSLASDWGKPGEGKMYDRMKTRLLDYIQILKNQGKTVIFKGFVWIQGEEDTKTVENSNSYTSNLNILINDVKSIASANGNLNPKIILSIADFSPQVNSTSPEVLKAQQNYAKNNCYAIATSMRGLPQQDFLHVTPTGIIMHGERLYNDLKNLTYGLGANNVDITGLPTPTLNCGGAVSYCLSSSNNYSNIIISRIALGAINNYSSGSKYTDFTNFSSALFKGSTNSITLRAWLNSTTTSGFFSAWIDYNKNNVFEDSELIVNSNISASGETIKSFTVPNNAVEGSTRLRISLSQNGYPSPCETIANGEVEDYTINITAPATTDYCIPTVSNSSKIIISRVKIGTINNYTSGTKYTFYNALSTDITKGSNAITLRSWSSYTNPNYFYKVWIDYNQNKTFDSDEMILSKQLNIIGENNYSFSIPETAKTGATRMRIMLSKDSNLSNACTSINEGEVEDYSINIKDAITARVSASQKETSNDFDAYQIFDYQSRIIKNASKNYIETEDLQDGYYIIVLYKKGKIVRKINYRK